MKNLLIIVPILFLVLFSIKGFSQTDTTEQKSSTPLLDKYYPRAKKDTLANKTLPKSTGVNKPAVVNAPQTPLAPQKISEKKPLVVAPINLPAPAPELPAPVPVVPVQDTLVTVIAEAPVISPISNTQIANQSTPVQIQSDTAQIKIPVINTVVAPPPKKSVSQPETPYRSNRLGSSSPLYRTWEKNKNGAGSVTTMPKG